MNANWTTCKLKDIADVRVSNVDKKTSNAETPVKLCNYMDVYSNDYVTKSIEFMTASASKSEIERFGLQAGDVIITKDSETPDDIGVPAVVTHSIDGLVCGYHLALIRPRNSTINPIYLAKQLSTAQVSRYFALNATGSTRFGLPISVIEDTQVTVAPQSEQTEIAEILSTVDRAIEQTDALIAKQQRIKTGLMQNLLTRGIDNHGNLRSEQTHDFKKSPLGRIPARWETHQLSDLAEVDRGKFTHRPRNDPLFYGGEYPFIQTGDVTSRAGRIVRSYTQTLSKRGLGVSKQFPSGTIAVTIAANIGDTAILGIPMFFPDSVVGAIVRTPHNTRFIEMAIRRWKHSLETTAPKSAQRNINLEILRPLLIATPQPDEQDKIAGVYEHADRLHQQYEDSQSKLYSLKTSLMQDLLTGNRRVTSLC